MKKLNKLLILILCGILVFNPCYVGATEENTNIENNTTENENTNTENENTNEENSGGEENNENTETTPENGENTENNDNENQEPPQDEENTEEPPVVVEKSDIATLKSLTFKNNNLKLDKEFKSDVHEYTLNVPADVNSISKDEIKYELTDSKAEVAMINIPEIKTGKTITIIINAENHTNEKPNQVTYKLNIVKEELSLKLKKLEINGYALNETFDPEVQTYTVNIPYEVEIVTVNAVTEDKGVNVTINGNKNLVVGQNVVRITVGGTNVYKIIVIRSKESTVEENPTSIITSNITSNNTSNLGSNNSNSSDNELLKYVIVSLASLILFAIGGIGFYFYLKTSPKKLKKELNKQNNDNNINNDSPVVEVNENQEIVDNVEEDNSNQNSSNIGNLMDEKLVETREFTKDELNDTKLENLFDEE